MKNKEQLISEFLSQSIKTGDLIHIKGYGSQNKENWGVATVLFVDEDKVYVADRYDSGKKVSKDLCESHLISEIKRDTSHIGINPFKPEIRMRTYNLDLNGVLHRLGFAIEDYQIIARKKFQVDKDISIEETCFNPIVIDENGNEIEYQRGLVWSKLQKQLLIEAIFNNVDIGKFVVRGRAYEWAVERVKAGKYRTTGFCDLVDGKQRVTSIVEYIEGKFPSLDGYYWEDLSNSGKRHFLGYMNFSFAELDAKATDKDTINVFLAINHAGEPMSMKHIEFVKNISV